MSSNICKTESRWWELNENEQNAKNFFLVLNWMSSLITNLIYLATLFPTIYSHFELDPISVNVRLRTSFREKNNWSVCLSLCLCPTVSSLSDSKKKNVFATFRNHQSFLPIVSYNFFFRLFFVISHIFFLSQFLCKV